MLHNNRIFQQQIGNFLSDTSQARDLSERDRDYFDHNQWTAQQTAKLRSRKMAPIVVNRIKPKVEGLIGLYNLRHTDPKAFPRTKKHEKASEVITDALRFVADNNDLEMTKMEVAEDFWIEGYGGVLTDVRQKANGNIEVRVTRIPWDRIYFDPHSREKDFSDARYMGMLMWMGKDQLEELFPKANFDELLAQVSSDSEDGETFQDRPPFQDRQRNRVRIAFHFYMNKGVWWYTIFSGDTDLVDPQESPFLDDEGEPANIIELVSANVDRENNRYGEVRGYISQQDEINHRRSKALHLLSQRQTFGRKGTSKEVKALKRELSKPDGHVEFEGEAFGKDFGILPTADMAAGQFILYQDAKAELDAVGFNAQLSGERQQGDLSGVAISKLQQAGTLELNRQFAILNAWEKRVYRQIWARVKQFWDKEKWIRVTDNQDQLRWVGLNTFDITAQEWMEEQINDKSLSRQRRRQIAASFNFLMNAAQGPSPETIEAAKQGDQGAISAVQTSLQVQEVAQETLEQFVQVRNQTAEIEVDIVLDQSFDVVNIQEEQFAMLVQFAQGGDVDILDLIEVSKIRGKDELIEKIEARRQAIAESAGTTQQLRTQEVRAKTAETMSKVQINTEKAIQTKLENALLARSPPDRVTSVSV